MIPKTSSTGEYVYYEYPEYTNESEYVYDEEPETPQSRNATNIDCEYVYDDDEDGEYVLEKISRTKDSYPTQASNPENKKPGHQRAEPDLYDELDYELSPRVEVTNKKEGLSKQNKIIIVSVLVVCVVGALFLAFYSGAVFGSEGK